MFFVVLANVIKEYNLKVDSNLKSTSEIEMYFSVKELNMDNFNINLLQEDDVFSFPFNICLKV